MRAPKIKVDTISLGALSELLHNGEVRIPRFQREFVWGQKKTASLLDSMNREYPIGTFFFWKAPAKYNELIRVVDDFGQPQLDEDSDHLLILDGQQRITSLHAVISGKKIEDINYRDMALDLDNDPEENPFGLRKNIDNQRYVSVTDLLSDSDYGKILRGLRAESRKDRFLKVRERLRSYPLSVVYVEVANIEPAIEIFERINQEGQKLSRFDLVAANVYDHDSEFDLRERVEEDFHAKLREKGFGILPNSIIPQALAINLKKPVNFRSQIGLDRRKVGEVWKNTIDALLDSVDYLRENWGVENNKFLPYDQIVPVFAHYFYFSKKEQKKQNQNEHEQLKRWFWRVVFSERYGDTAQSRMQQDAEWMRTLVTDTDEVKLRFTVDESVLLGIHMTQRSAVKNGVLCILNLQGPKHFATGGIVSLSDDHFSSLTKAERHHIFPVSYLMNNLLVAKRAVHRLPNFCFIPADLNKEISDKAPSKYMRDYQERHESAAKFTEIMESHLIPVDDGSPIWTNDYEDFLERRAKRMLQKARELAGVTEP